ncbi:MAG: CpsB/CapC family capsule biosynthesis tyrosine phosphatase [Clostridia bacterium]
MKEQSESVVKTHSFVDFHIHILPGMDDGAKTVSDSLAMLRLSAQQNIRRLIATPHFYPAAETPDDFLRRRDRAVAELLRADMQEDVTLYVGAEVAYYQGIGNMSKARMMNQKLESILREKRDSDAFLDVLATRFKGTYIVDMKTDMARVIYKPMYFSEILERNRYRFLPSMGAYNDAFVAEEDRADFEKLLDYGVIEEQLRTQTVIKHAYRKKDGTKLTLRVYPTRDYGPESAETIWLFEEDSD